MLHIRAGKNALEQIQQEGLSQSMFSTLLGASGGPKWFVLYGLDKYLFGEFFKGRTETLDVIGSSAGAFRSACFAQQDPVAATERLAKHYSETQYSSNRPTPKEITLSAIDLLDKLLGDNGAKEIIENPIVRAHFVVAKAKGVVASENKLLQTIGLLNSYVKNRISRDKLTSQYQRYIFHTPGSQVRFAKDKFETFYVPFTEQNLIESLTASGSIPLVMKGIRDIQGAAKGMYRDGGIIDYHFDVGLNNTGLILYPHFSSEPKAGWFDKSLPRKVNPDHYKDVLLISPSADFVANLPYGKIPDRTDFENLEYPERIKYWRSVFGESERMAEALAEMIEKQDFSQINPW